MKKKRLIKYFQFGLAFLLTMIGLEIYMRIASISISPWTRLDSRLGRVYKPGARVVLFKEGFGKGRINKYGYIGPAYGPEREKNTLRIALLGDSNVEGHLLFERHTLARILEEQLSGILNQKVEVLNFGSSGPILQQLFINYREWALRFNADYYLVFLGRNKLLRFAMESGPYCYQDGNSLGIRFRKQQRFKELAFLRNLSLYQQAHSTFKPIILKLFQSILSRKDINNAQEFQDEEALYDINRLILLTLEQINYQQKHKIILVIENNIPQKYKSLISGFGEYTVDLSSQFDLMKKGGIDPYYWKGTGKHGHWNQQAHRMAANYLARQFMQRFLATVKK